MEGQISRRRASKLGVVVSDRMEKSVVVRVERLVPHRRYKRFVRRTAKFLAHDEQKECRVGDLVEIVESRPLSRRKRWRVRRIVKRAVERLEESPEEPQAASGV